MEVLTVHCPAMEESGGGVDLIGGAYPSSFARCEQTRGCYLATAAAS
ncbi:MAG TPA: hypothetical protein VHV82_01850 [Sporichthyaceae bacterium]|nr:hypothetical protein [Sporichthyaceae bacterium]